MELTPLKRKSFYGKATMHRNDNITTLTSYVTDVAEYNHETKKMKVNGWYSNTTARHINAFLDHFGFNTCTKAELEKEYNC